MGIAKLWLVYLCLVVVSSYSAPLDAAKGRKEMEELRERLREIRDMPGLDKEEYLRYWQEVAKNDPSELVLHTNTHPQLCSTSQSDIVWRSQPSALARYSR